MDLLWASQSAGITAVLALRRGYCPLLAVAGEGHTETITGLGDMGPLDGRLDGRRVEAGGTRRSELNDASQPRRNGIRSRGTGRACTSGLQRDGGQRPRQRLLEHHWVRHDGRRGPQAGTVIDVTADGSIRHVADEVYFPNGMTVTSDGSTLILAESHANRLTAFTIEPDGSLSGRRVWANLGEGALNGICVDREDAVWYAVVPNACCVASVTAAKSFRSFNSTVAPSPVPWQVPNVEPLHIAATVWQGADTLHGQPAQRTTPRVDVDIPEPAGRHPKFSPSSSPSSSEHDGPSQRAHDLGLLHPHVCAVATPGSSHASRVN
jgi:hypothetical protein